MTNGLGAALLLSGVGLAAQGLVEGRAGSPVRVVISDQRTDSTDRLLYHKTNHRAPTALSRVC